MSSRDIREFECDRCGVKTVRDPDSQTLLPTGWQKFARLNPITGNVDAGRNQWDLCRGCDSQVRRLLQPINQPNNRVEREDEVAEVSA